jgi:hypothetical protein
MRRLPGFALALLCLVPMMASVGCATPHQITMKDGRVIEAKDEPEPEKGGTGFYVFEDEDGKKVRLNKDEIVEIRAK